MTHFIPFSRFVATLLQTDTVDATIENIKSECEAILAIRGEKKSDYYTVFRDKREVLRNLFEKFPHLLDNSFSILDMELITIQQNLHREYERKEIMLQIGKIKSLAANRRVRAIHPDAFKYVTNHYRLPFGVNWSKEDYSTWRKMLNLPGYLVLIGPAFFDEYLLNGRLFVDEVGNSSTFEKKRPATADEIRKIEDGRSPPANINEVEDWSAGNYTLRGLKEFFIKVHDDMSNFKTCVDEIIALSQKEPLSDVQVDVSKYNLFRNVA